MKRGGMTFEQALALVTMSHTRATPRGLVLQDARQSDALLMVAWQVIREKQGMACVTAI